MKFRLSCPAKINLYLKIISQYKNNYHEIESILSFIDLYDYLEINISKTNNKSQIKLRISSDLDIADINSNNILTNIHRYFVNNYNINYDFDILINKNIPLGSGLGGASSNAATFIKFINNQFNLQISEEELHALSFKFGSDIAFFLADKSSIIRDIGHIACDYQKNIKQDILIIYPNINIATSKIFNLYNSKFSSKTPDNIINNTDQLEILINFDNDLENIVLNYYPLILEIKNYILKLNPVKLKMSGSGSTFFAIFSNKNDLENAKKSIQKHYPSIFIKKCKILDHYDEKI